MERKPLEFKNEVFTKIFGREPDVFRHKWSLGDKWEEIPEGESIGYNFWDGNVVSESELLFGSNRPGIDAQVLVKIIGEIGLAYLGGVVIEKLSTFYLAVSTEGLTGAMELYRTGKLLDNVQFYKELTALRNIGTLNEAAISTELNV
jgi:hypothetical protein